MTAAPGRSARATPQGGAIAVRVEGTTARVLLVRARLDPTVWIFPKGHVEPGETLEETALRELREEAGYDGRVIATVGSSEFASDAERVRVTYFLVLVPPGAEPAPSEDRERRWCSVAEAAELLSFADARALLARASEQVTTLLGAAPA